ncbi:hypothetical protein [Streptomyces aureocirculatus]|uniref:hypothetical protein n=1 Tax=Streptomyces aureocirculatus TaxID=67275 RepID=UPI0004C680D1|nr:hypothetical protein [Streptomyces aureocirculatus]
MTDDIAAFVAAHPPHPGFSADQMIATWDSLASLTEVAAIATEVNEARSTLQDETACRRQLSAAVRWVKEHHGDQVADAFVTYLGATSSKP